MSFPKLYDKDKVQTLACSLKLCMQSMLNQKCQPARGMATKTPPRSRAIIVLMEANDILELEQPIPNRSNDNLI
jgi:hypothetical protein